MTYFTDSPYERMMMQKPAARREPPKKAARPCGDCPYYKGQPCVGICCRTLLEKHGRKPGKAGGINE